MIDAMFVDFQYRHLGIGTKLIDEFKKWSKEQKAKFIELKVCQKNSKAIHLYKKNKCKEIKTIMSLEI